jgi:5-bromo-4-chloroindolyl phosphate hydrolysis protein
MDNKTQTTIRGALSGVVGGATFIIFSFALGTALPVSLVASIGGFVGSFLLLRKKKDDGMDIIVGDLSKKAYDEAMSEVAGRLKELTSYAAMIKDQNVRHRAEQIADVVKRIHENFKKDPKDVKAGRQFINYYLDATVKILRRYVELSAHDRGSEEVRTALGKTEILLDTIRDAFERQLTLLLRDDIMDLEMEIKVLEKTIKLEGLGEK